MRNIIEQVDSELTRSTNQLVEISAECPYFFELKSLIAGRPSVVATGLGNNDDEIDMSLLLDSYHPSESSGTEGDLFQPEHEESGDEDEEGIRAGSPAEAPDSDGGDEADSASDDLAGFDAAPSVPAKRKAAEKVENKRPVKKTGPRAGNSAPAPAPIKPKKSISSMDRFATVATAEEVTVQKKIDLKRAKIIGEKEVEIESTKAKANLQIRKEELKTQFAMEKLRLEHEKLRLDHEMRMAELQARNQVDRFQSFQNPSAPHHDRLNAPFASSSHSSTSTPGFAQYRLPAIHDNEPELTRSVQVAGISLDGNDPFAFTPT